MAELPKFETISVTMVRCDRDPAVCSERSGTSRGVVKQYYCWHPDSPEPDHTFVDASYRICMTEPNRGKIGK